MHPLEALLLPVLGTALVDGDEVPSPGSGRVVCASGDGPLAVLRAGAWHVIARPGRVDPAGTRESIQTFFTEDGRHVHAVLDHETGDVVIPFSLREAHHAYVAEQWTALTSSPRLSAGQLKFFYAVKRLIPRSLQLSARRALMRRQGTPEFPAWPLDTSVSRLLRFYAHCRLRARGSEQEEFVWFWPHAYRSAIVLSHDVESHEGIRLALELADLEQELGFRSCFNFGGWYDVDPGVLRELTERGFEIGSHALVHDRSLFSSRGAFEQQLPALRDLHERLGAVGFRSPATHRVFDWLAELPVEYDCTIPNSDPYEPQPGGCCSVFPFWIGHVVELPYTLPQDHTLLTLLGRRSPELWLEQSAAIEREHGLIQCLSHPDRGYLGDADKRAVYAEFLRGIAEREGIWRTLPRDAAAWWRERSAGAAGTDALGHAVVRLAGESGVVFEPPAPATRSQF